MLINDCCLNAMRHLPDNSIDMVLTDPPYRITNATWDTSIIPLQPMWEQINRITKQTAAIVLHAAQPFTTHLIASNIKHFKYNWYWQKPQGTGHLNCKIQPLRNIEEVVVFYRRQCTYNPQMTEGKPYSKSGAGGGGLYNSYGSFRNENKGTRYPITLQQFKKDKDNYHPTQKPIALLEYLISTYTNEEDVVLDFTMGSGSTGCAAKNLNRHFIGIEKDKKFFDIASVRIEEA